MRTEALGAPVSWAYLADRSPVLCLLSYLHRYGFLAIDVPELVVVYLRGQPFEDYLPVLQGDQTSAIGPRQAEEVKTTQRRAPELPVQLLQVLEYGMRGSGVQAGHRFVGQQQLGILHQRPGDADSLLLPPTQLVSTLVGLIQDAHGLQGLPGLCHVLLRKAAEGAAPRVHVTQSSR